LYSGLHRLADRLSRNDSRSLDLDSLSGDIRERSFAVNGVPQSINNASKETFSARHVHNVSSPLDQVAFLYQTVVSKDDNPDIVRFQIECHSLDSTRKLYHFLCLHVLQPIHTTNSISNRQHSTSLINVN